MKKTNVSSLEHPSVYALFLLIASVFLTVRTWTHAIQFVVTREDRGAALALTLFTWVQYAQHYVMVLWTGFEALRAWLLKDGVGGYTRLSNSDVGIRGLEDSNSDESYRDRDATDRSFSLLIALLLLLVMQVYYTTDTPYGTLMVTLFLARSCHKVLQRASGSRVFVDGSWGSGVQAPDGNPIYVRLMALSALGVTLIDLFTAVVLVRGLALVQQDAVHMQLHVVAVVMVGVVVAMSMVRFEATLV